MKSLVAITVLTLLLIASNSIAQSNEGLEPMLLARAETHESSISKIANAREKFKGNIKNESRRDRNMDDGYSYYLGLGGSAILDSRGGSRDISLLIKNELELERSLDLQYKSPKLKAEQLPLVMSSKNKKTKGAVFPPFVFFKKQF